MKIMISLFKISSLSIRFAAILRLIAIPVAVIGMASGCASYVTPGGPVNLADIDRADIAEAASRKPSPNFPARIAIVRVQAPDYHSYTSQASVSGRFSVITTRELLTNDQLEAMEQWPSVAGVVPVNRLLLPSQVDSLDDLRVAAAKVQADILMVYTLDTTFRVEGRGYGPLALISLGLVPDRDAYVTSTASVLFVDVRTGFVYGLAEATAKESGLTNAWGSNDTIDRKRMEAEKAAFTQMLPDAEKTWSGVASKYGE